MLTDTSIRTVKPTEKPQKLFDGGGLFLLVKPSGARLWRFKYRIDGREKLLALGRYPDVPLKKARIRRDDARRLVADGVDPSAKRQAEKLAQADTFKAVALEWIEKFSPEWTDGYIEKTKRRFERNLFPWIGSQPISKIKAPELLACLRRIENRHANETAHRVLQQSGQVFRYAIATARAERDISADLRGSLSPVEVEHFAAITDPKKAGGLLRAIDSYAGQPTTVIALKLAPHLFLRPGELRTAEWSEFNFEAAERRIPGEKMKMDNDHIVPLSSQSLELLCELRLLTGSGRLLFPSLRGGGRPMSENTINAALRRLGYGKDEMTGHGFRAMARTILDEVLGYRVEWIEHQLAHAVKDPNGRAYNRTAHLEGRRKMMQGWSNYLDSLKAGAEVISINRVSSNAA